ncbi:MAG: RecX family transcriptional regulator [Clostridia bacterium]|nr:RecX family transcriptional regulator [Clostridia bacterium]
MIIDSKLMKYVLFKKRTEHEVREKCKTLNYNQDYIDEIIDYLKEAEYINDEIYITKYINNLLKLKKSSVAEVKLDFMKRGIDFDKVDSDLVESLYEHEKESAIYLASKKYKSGDTIEKIKRYLNGKGYAYSNISNAIDNLNILDDN